MTRSANHAKLERDAKESAKNKAKSTDWYYCFTYY